MHYGLEVYDNIKVIVLCVHFVSWKLIRPNEYLVSLMLMRNLDIATANLRICNVHHAVVIHNRRPV